MKAKKLITLLCLAAMTTQSLVACVGNSETNSTITNKQINNNVTGPNDDNDVWANITQTDGAYQNSRLAFAANNRSNYNLVFVGCDDEDYLNTHLQNINSGYAFPRSKNYDQKWKSLDTGDGLFDAAHIGPAGTFAQKLTVLINLLHGYFCPAPRKCKTLKINLESQGYLSSPQRNEVLWQTFLTALLTGISSLMAQTVEN